MTIFEATAHAKGMQCDNFLRMYWFLANISCWLLKFLAGPWLKIQESWQSGILQLYINPLKILSNCLLALAVNPVLATHGCVEILALRADDKDRQAIMDKAKHLLKQEVRRTANAINLAAEEAASESEGYSLSYHFLIVWFHSILFQITTVDSKEVLDMPMTKM